MFSQFCRLSRVAQHLSSYKIFLYLLIFEQLPVVGLIRSKKSFDSEESRNRHLLITNSLSQIHFVLPIQFPKMQPAFTLQSSQVQFLS